MTSAAIHDLVVGTGRLSAALFVAALLGAGAGYRAVPLWLAFVAAHTVHFSFVAWLAAASDGANLRDIGGWPTALGGGLGALPASSIIAPIRRRRLLRAVVYGPSRKSVISIRLEPNFPDAAH